MIVQEGGPRRNAFSTEQSQGQKVQSAIKSNVPDNYTNKDKYPEWIGQREAMKYLRENCYHRIECSAANSLAALMRKWYLNSSFQPYNYSSKILEMCWCDKDQHQQSNLHVEDRDERRKIA